MIKISNTGQDRIVVSFSYSPDFVQKVKSIKGNKWHPEGKYWSFPNTNGTFEKILEVFKGEKVHIDPALQIHLFSVIARDKVPKQSHSFSHDFQDLTGKKATLSCMNEIAKMALLLNAVIVE